MYTNICYTIFVKLFILLIKNKKQISLRKLFLAYKYTKIPDREEDNTNKKGKSLSIYEVNSWRRIYL